MKTIKLLIIVPLMALFIQGTIAKSQIKGIYLTSQDYLNHKLSYSSDKIRINNFFESKNLILVHDGQKQVLSKNKIFGYSKNGEDFRFFNNAEYHILSNNGLLIYSHTTLVQQGKGPKSVEQYYFSPGLSEPIQSLTIANLQSAYGKYPKFIYAVEGLFKNDAQLASYDTYNKQYKVAYLYEQNVK